MDKLIAQFKSLIAQLQAYIATLKPMPIPPTPTPVPPNNMLNTFCLAIQNHEGWILNPPSRSVKNHNPGNCRFYTGAYLEIYQPVYRDKDSFAVFKDYQTGFLYLKNLVREKVKNHPDADFYDFFAVYAPRDDGNNPIAYANAVAKALNVSPTIQLSTILV